MEARERALEVREERQETKEKTLEERERIFREREKMLDEREKRLEDRGVRIGDEEKRLDQMGKQAGEKTAATDRQIETAQRKEKEAEEKSSAADTATVEAQKQAASQEGELKGQREAAQSFLNQAMQRISDEDASLNAKRAKLDKDTEEAEELANSYQVEVKVKDADLHDRKRALDKTYEDLQRRKAVLENREAKIKSMADKVKNDLALENRWLDDGQEQMRRETALATRNSRMAERYLQQAITYHECADKYLSGAKDLHTRSLEWSLLANERSDQVRSLFADTNDLFGRLKDFHSTESRIKTWRQHYDGLEGLQISIKKHMEAADRRDDKAKELMADVQRSTADAIGKLTSGSNSASDAFRDLTDRMAATSVRESRPTRAAVTSTELEAISTETGATIPAEGAATTSAAVEKRVYSQRGSLEGYTTHKRTKSASALDTLGRLDTQTARSPRGINSPTSPLQSPSGPLRLQPSGLSIPDRTSSAAAVHGQAGRSQTTLAEPQLGASDQAGSSAQAANLDPAGLNAATEEMQEIWRQIQLPDNWTIADSDLLLLKFQKARGRAGKKKKELKKAQRYWPQQGMDKIAGDHAEKSYSDCLPQYIAKLKREWDAGKEDKPCHGCTDVHSGPDVCVDVFYVESNPGEYDATNTGKRWRVVKRE